eukprot:TRINITY_DN6844_c0_g2_i1.p1 TRINITY_DN6844_c0_g2~~TRINITY_DN6844_c0_g2_i1.p1  ORF type:complete len:457 (-),score=137.22 TRINITY_DN6844_c0_g2_i1:628-1998(-)
MLTAEAAFVCAFNDHIGLSRVLTSKMLSALLWVKGSAAKSHPIVSEDPIEEEEGEEMEEDQMEEEKPKGGESIESIYNLDDYDEEETPLFAPNPKSLMAFASNKEDPYLTNMDEEEDSDIEDFIIRPTDAIIIGAHTEEEMSYLDIFIYEEKEENVFVHHDVILSTFPLSISWLDYKKGSEEKGNFVAVGTFEPQIEIWDIDVVDAIQPVATLGLSIKQTKKKNAKNINSHTSSVLSLSWNRHARNILASGSADNTVKVWDLSNETCLQTLFHHKDKVQAVEWHPLDPKILLSGSFDRHVSVLDARYPQMANSALLTADVECIEWNPHAPQQFFAGSEDGVISCFDVRTLDKPIWSLNAHTKAASAVNINPGIPNYFVSVSDDKQLKLWSLDDGQPTCIYSEKTKLALFDVSFYSESPFLLVAGGKGGDETGTDPRDLLYIVNTAQFSEVKEKFRL